MEKQYALPQFQLVRQNDSNKIFFAASGTPGAPALGGALGAMTKTNGSW